VISAPRINKFPVFFPVSSEIGREGLARDYTLRHTVCSAEKSTWIAFKIAENGRNFAILALKPDWRMCPTNRC
jgi:hypothetical protein